MIQNHKFSVSIFDNLYRITFFHIKNELRFSFSDWRLKSALIECPYGCRFDCFRRLEKVRFLQGLDSFYCKFSNFLIIFARPYQCPLLQRKLLF